MLVSYHRSDIQKLFPAVCNNTKKAFQVKLVDKVPRVCKAVIKAKGGYFEESKIYLNLFNTFGYYMIPCVIS
jgi:hypothetical protein